MARMPRIEDFVGQLDFGGDGNGDGDGDNRGTAVQKQFGISGSLKAQDVQAVQKITNVAAVAARDAARFASVSDAPSAGQPLRISGTPVSRGNVTYNVYTSAITERTFQNSAAKTANKIGIVKTTRPGALDFGVSRN